jgi:hypothetical protein
VEDVLSQASAFPAYTTIVAVVNILVWVIVPQLTNITIIPGRPLAAINAELTSLLGTIAYHAEHVLSSLPVQDVIFNFVMTQTTCIPSIAVCTL